MTDSTTGFERTSEIDMPADDERREVAARLMDEVGCGSSWPGMERLGLILGIEREPRTGWEGRILTRLADLIYPGDTSLSCRDIVACDRDALLELAEDVDEAAAMAVVMDASKGAKMLADLLLDISRRIREALGEVES